MRKVADLGQPMAGPVQASTSSMVMPSWPIRRMACEHGEGADAVGDEIGRVLGAHYALAQYAVAEIGERIEDFGPRGRAGNQFDQLHVARRVEEMRAGPMLLEFGGEAGGDLADRAGRRCWW